VEEGIGLFAAVRSWLHFSMPNSVFLAHWFLWFSVTIFDRNKIRSKKEMN
jgi:hypothetical protein